jgi:hypothetical protein
MGPTGSGPINQAGPHKTQQDQAEETPTREARHLAIVEQQARLAAERTETRADLVADPRRLVTREVVDAVRAAGAVWGQQLERDRWVQALGETIREFELAPDQAPAQVALVLAAWDRACEAAGGPLAVEAAPRGSWALPTRAALWYASGGGRRWVASQLRPAGARGEAGSSRTATPIGCSAVADVPLLGGRSW